MPFHRSAGSMQQRILAHLATVPAGEWVPTYVAADATTRAEQVSARRAAAALAANGDVLVARLHAPDIATRVRFTGNPVQHVRLAPTAAEAEAQAAVEANGPPTWRSTGFRRLHAPVAARVGPLSGHVPPRGPILAPRHP